MAVHNFAAKLISKQQLTEIVFLYRFAIPENLQFAFTPGQFVSVIVAKNIRRSYSIANTGDTPVGFMDLLVDIAPGGPGSQFFVGIEVGSEAQMLGPLGSFVYRAASRDLHFYATGTGIAPFMPMIYQELDEIKSGRQIKLFLGFRYVHDIFWQNELERLRTNYQNFDFEIFVSRPDTAWQGKSGYINQYIATLENPKLDAYICGGTGMIKDTAEKLALVGVPTSQIYYEKYY
jgi:NAD(P)H-flavin reductase